MTLSKIARFQLSKSTALIISRGSVLDFSCKRDAAIVNAANEGCLGGGGVDGAISEAGGDALFQDRFALPVIRGQHIRCPTGDAKLTGPGQYGDIQTNYVIHAVGPNYNRFFLEEYNEADTLLQDAYRATMDRADEAKLKEVAFSLLSAGIFKGSRTMSQVLRLGIEGIVGWVGEHPETSVECIHMCAFTPREATILCKVSKRVIEGESAGAERKPTAGEEGKSAKKRPASPDGPPAKDGDEKNEKSTSSATAAATGTAKVEKNKEASDAATKDDDDDEKEKKKSPPSASNTTKDQEAEKPNGVQTKDDDEDEPMAAASPSSTAMEVVATNDDKSNHDDDVDGGEDMDIATQTQTETMEDAADVKPKNKDPKNSS